MHEIDLINFQRFARGMDRATSRSQEALREQLGRFPPIYPHVFLTGHSFPEDFTGLGDIIQQSDIYIPEGMGWSEYDKQTLQKVSDGKFPPSMFIYGSPEQLSREQREDLFKLAQPYNTGKPVVLIDMPYNHPLYQKYQAYFGLNRPSNYFAFEHIGIEVKQEPSGYIRYVLHKNFTSAVEAMKRYALMFTKMSIQRETYMIESLPSALEEAIERVPELREKPGLNIAFMLGTAHIQFVDSLKRAGLPVTQSYPESEIAKTYFNEICETIRGGDQIPDDLAARALFTLLRGPLIHPEAIRDIYSTNEFINLLQYRIEPLSLDDMKGFYERLQQTDGDARQLNIWVPFY